MPATFHAGIEDVLLTALALAVGERRREPGPVLVELEGHGRDPIDASVDVSRTVGWFTSVFPALLDPGAIDLADARAGGPAIGQALKRVKQQLRDLPVDRGGYLRLRQSEPDGAWRPGAAAGVQLPRPDGGRGRRRPRPSADWTIAAESDAIAAGVDPQMPVAHVIAIDAFTEDGPGGPRLTATWTWPGELLGEQDVRPLADAWLAYLAALVDHAERPEAGGHTPSDLELVSLSQDEIDEIELGWDA